MSPPGKYAKGNEAKEDSQCETKSGKSCPFYTFLATQRATPPAAVFAVFLLSQLALLLSKQLFCQLHTGTQTMAPAHKESLYLVIQPGSLNTLVKFGLEDPIGLPSHCIPTKVYASSANGVTNYSMSNQENYHEVLPIVAGNIVNVEALQFFLKSVVKSMIKPQDPVEEEDNNSSITVSNEIPALDTINVLLVQSSSSWNPFKVESIVNYFFESLGVNSISIVPLELCAMFSYGSYSNALVIDIGYEKTEILPIIDFQLYGPSKKIINKGSKTINDTLVKLLPNFTGDQIECLKKSTIFECLSEEDAKKSFFGMEGLVENLDDQNSEGNLEDEGILDIAAIVTSEKSTREILEDNQKKMSSQNKNHLKPNSELETNSFYDSDGVLLNVGKERFQGCNDLIDYLVFNIYHCLSRIPDLKKRQECYDNIIIIGQTSKIKGLKEKIIFKLLDNYVILSDNKLLQPQSQFRNDVRPVDDNSITQVPRHLKLVPKIEYFSEWKKHGFEDCSFLGAQILSKQVFNNSELSLTKETYQKSGPISIWSTCL